MNLEFDYNKFVNGYYSYSKKIFDKNSEQLGYYRVRCLERNSCSVLTVAFIKDRGIDDSWKTTKPMRVWKKIGKASILHKNFIIDSVNDMNKELCRFISGKRVKLDWKKHI